MTPRTGLGWKSRPSSFDDLASGVANESVKSSKVLDDTSARVDLALAGHYHEIGTASMAQDEHVKIGYWL
jgi:hypothetical protein